MAQRYLSRGLNCKLWLKLFEVSAFQLDDRPCPAPEKRFKFFFANVNTVCSTKTLTLPEMEYFCSITWQQTLMKYFCSSPDDKPDVALFGKLAESQAFPLARTSQPFPGRNHICDGKCIYWIFLLKMAHRGILVLSGALPKMEFVFKDIDIECC